MEYFLKVVTQNTLFVVDELCRSTSLEEGTALAMALCEKCKSTNAFTFFTTHFKFLTRLTDMYVGYKTLVFYYFNGMMTYFKTFMDSVQLVFLTSGVISNFGCLTFDHNHT